MDPLLLRVIEVNLLQATQLVGYYWPASNLTLRN